MVTANVEIIELLRSYLKIMINDPGVRANFTLRPEDFTRDRKLPMDKLVGMLINLPKRSLTTELQSFFESLEQLELCCTKGAFSLQRTKLKPLFFEVWNKLLVDDFYACYNNYVKRWECFKLMAVDGSNVNMVNKPEIVKYFGTADNQFGRVPMARAMQIHDVLNDLTIWAGVFPRSYSENKIIEDNIRHLPTDSLTLFDRGYPSYSLMYLLMNEESPRHFVMRCKLTFSKEVKAFVASGQTDLTTNIYPSAESIEALRRQGYLVARKTALTIRMIKVILPDGEIEVLLTNLYDKEKFTARKFGKLYQLRWGIETHYSKQKNQMQMEIFSGHRVVCIKQDYAAGVFVSNLQNIIEKPYEADVKIICAKRYYDYKINRNVGLGSLKNRIVKLLTSDSASIEILSELRKLFIKSIEPVRPGRLFPRKPPKRKRGKYQTFTNYRRAI